MPHDLENLSLDELKALQKDVARAIKSFEKRKQREAYFAAQKVVREHGFSLDEIMGVNTGTKGAPKYVNPGNPAQTWTGRGRQPQWLKDALAAGKSLEDMTI